MKVAPWLNRLQTRLALAQSAVSSTAARVSGFRRPGAARRRNRSDRDIQKLEDRALLSVQSVLIGTELIIDTTDGEDLTIQQDAVTGNVQVLANGIVADSTPAIAADQLTSLLITADDRDNVINVSPLSAAAFTSLTSIRIHGSNGDDQLIGSDDFAEELLGEDGSDTLIGGGGNDSLDGADGDDVIDGADGDNVITGGDGQDVITTGIGNNTIDAGDGNDSVTVGVGDNSVVAGNGSDTVSTGDGSAFVDGGEGNDVITVGLGQNTVNGGNGADSITGGAGADLINGQGGNDTVNAGAGNDSVRGAGGADQLNGDAGDDVLNGQGGNDTITGGADNDRILGGGGGDTLFAELDGSPAETDDSDTLLGQGGNDSLFSFIGADVLNGGSGNDLLQTASRILPGATVDSVVLAAEGAPGTTASVTFTITLDAPAAGGESVDFTTTDGSATAGLDYTATSGTVQFLAGETTQTITVDILGDGLQEGDEFFLLDLSNPVGLLISVSQGSALITDDDGLRLFAVFSTGSEIVELNPNTGAQLNSFTTPAPTTGGPDGIAYDGTSVFFLAGNSTIFELDPDTGAILDQDSFTPGAFDGIATLNNNVYLMNFGTNDILIFDTINDVITGTLDIDGINPGMGIVGGLGAVSGGGGPDRLVATDFGTQQVHEIDPVTGVITNTFSPGTPGAFSYFGVAALNGEIYLGSNGTQSIDVFTRAGTLVRSMNVGAPITALGGDGLVANTSPPPPPFVPPLVLGPQGDTLLGGSGRDTILAGEFDDFVVGGGGRDFIDAGAGNDSVLGGAGNDTLDGGEGFDTLDGQGGNDVLIGGADSDIIRWMGSGDGRDRVLDSVGLQTLVIQADSSDSTLTVDTDSGKLRVTEGTASITASDEIGVVSVLGGAGNDTITVQDLSSARPAILVVDGQGGDDSISAMGAEYGDVFVELNGGEGNDTISGSAERDRIDGGAGDDLINGNVGDDILFGGEDNDTIIGGNGNDSIDGSFGADLLQGDDGDDTVSGGFGNDTLNGGEGNDLLDGGFERDVLNGGVGDDTLSGGHDNDTLLGALGNDHLDGGTGNDRIKGQGGNDSIRGGDGNDRIFGNAGADVIDAGDGHDTVDAGSGNDIVFGGDGNDIINGMNGRDTLIGHDGNDQVIGGSGVDLLFGGDGNDGLSGNGSRDRFNSGRGDDTFSDLQPNEFDDGSLLVPQAVTEALAALDMA